MFKRESYGKFIYFCVIDIVTLYEQAMSYGICIQQNLRSACTAADQIWGFKLYIEQRVNP